MCVHNIYEKWREARVKYLTAKKTTSSYACRKPYWLLRAQKTPMTLSKSAAFYGDQGAIQTSVAGRSVCEAKERRLSYFGWLRALPLPFLSLPAGSYVPQFRYV